MARTPRTGGMSVDQDLVRELAQLLEDTGLSEIEVEDGDRRIRVARQIGGVMPAPMPLGAPGAIAGPAAPPAPGATEAASADLKSHAGAVRSPMVGTVYLAPEPGAANFVKEGDEVAEGDTLVVVEAMKVMNPIPAPRAGRVTRICVTNEEPVEFDQILAVIE